jgi:hypothetical protein
MEVIARRFVDHRENILLTPLCGGVKVKCSLYVGLCAVCQYTFAQLYTRTHFVVLLLLFEPRKQQSFRHDDMLLSSFLVSLFMWLEEAVK